jgi:hypothetical protein
MKKLSLLAVALLLVAACGGSAPDQGNGFYANVHTGPDLSSAANAAPCACGDLSDTKV